MSTDTSVREAWNRILHILETRVFGVSNTNGMYSPDIRLHAVERYLLIPITTACIKQRIENIDIQIKVLDGIAKTL